MTPKLESEDLMNAMLPVAKRMLREYGEFFPYGGYMKPDGEIVHVGAKKPRTDRPKSKDLIAILENSFRELATQRKCKAVAIIYDVVAPPPNSNRQSNAIQVCLEHVDHYSVEVFFPYRIIEGEVVFEDIFAQAGKHRFFGQTT